jgi:surfeit locus 1 family protein
LRRFILFGICVLVSVLCIGLGVWQLGRLGERRAANRAVEAQRATPPADFDPAASPAEWANRQVRVRGELDPEREFVLRGRVVQGVPAVQIVTPLRLAGRDTALLVNRGYVPAPDAVRPAAGGADWAEPNPVRLSGVLLPMPDRGDGTPLTRNGAETWKALDLTAMRARLPYPIAAWYLLVTADSVRGPHTAAGGGYPIRAEPPPLDDGPHLMYAVQWFGIAAAVLAFGVLFVLRRRQPVTVDR